MMPSARVELAQFHESHFTGQQSPPISHPTLGFALTNALHGLQNTAPQDDALGHYEDGVKRTLTDDQIAIFRHTEIQELLNDRERSAGLVAEARRSDYEKEQTRQREISLPEIGHWQGTEPELIDKNAEDTLGEDAQTNRARSRNADQIPMALCHDNTSLDYGDEFFVAVPPVDAALMIGTSCQSRKVVMYKGAFKSPRDSQTSATTSMIMPANLQ